MQSLGTVSCAVCEICQITSALYESFDNTDLSPVVETSKLMEPSEVGRALKSSPGYQDSLPGCNLPDDPKTNHFSFLKDG